MKKILKSSLAAALMLMAITVSSCKDNKEEVDTTTIETETEEVSTATDTATVVNDTNVSGTTSGEMEQVP